MAKWYDKFDRMVAAPAGMTMDSLAKDFQDLHGFQFDDEAMNSNQLEEFKKYIEEKVSSNTNPVLEASRKLKLEQINEIIVIRDYLMNNTLEGDKIPFDDDTAFKELLTKATAWKNTPTPENTLIVDNDLDGKDNENCDFTEERAVWQNYCTKNTYEYKEQATDDGSLQFKINKPDNSNVEVKYHNYNHVGMVAKDKNGDDAIPSGSEFVVMLNQAKKRGIKNVSLGDIKHPQYKAKLLVASVVAGLNVTNPGNIESLLELPGLSDKEIGVLQDLKDRVDAKHRQEQIKLRQDQIKEAKDNIAKDPKRLLDRAALEDARKIKRAKILTDTQAAVDGYTATAPVEDDKKADFEFKKLLLARLTNTK